MRLWEFVGVQTSFLLLYFSKLCYVIMIAKVLVCWWDSTEDQTPSHRILLTNLYVHKFFVWFKIQKTERNSTMISTWHNFGMRREVTSRNLIFWVSLVAFHSTRIDRDFLNYRREALNKNEFSEPRDVSVHLLFIDQQIIIDIWGIKRCLFLHQIQISN